MEVLLFLKSIIVSVLVAYLSITNTLALHIESLFIRETPQEAVIEPVEAVSEEIVAVATPSEELVALSRSFSAQTEIPRVLRDHATFQEAALAASAQAKDIETDKNFTDERIKNALVNIICEYRTDEYIRTTTGTGFFIDDRGIILTNAHVAQFLLLKEVDDTVKKAECTIRTGDPAEARYRADILYISPTWVLKNAALIDDETPRGTGEYDYALLYVTKSSDASELPDTFPSLLLHTDFLPRSMDGQHIVSAGYPAEKLARKGANAKLVPVVAETTLEELYTFGSNYADIFAISESAVGEQGTSGGPVLDQSKGVIGLIVTKGDEEVEGKRSLRAFTLSYIDRAIKEETGYSLSQNTLGDLSYRGKIFKDALIPFLAGLLEDEL